MEDGDFVEIVLEMMREYYQWIVANKEWLFSGVGGLIFSGIAGVFISQHKARNKVKNNMSLVKMKTLSQKGYKKSSSNEKALSVTSKQKKELSDTHFNEVDNVINRFIDVYSSHGILKNQIPDIINCKFSLKISDFYSKDTILNILSSDLLEWTSSYFGIQRGWLDGTTQQKYEYRNYYKDIQSFISLVVDLKYKENKEITAYFYKHGNIDCESEKQQDIVIMLRYPIGKIIKKTIYRYIPISTRWNWGYWRTRYQIKSIIYILERLKISMCGYDLDQDIAGCLVNGQLFPELIINHSGFTWYPGDYIDLPSETTVSKEGHETQKVINYIEEKGYIRYLNSEIKKAS